MFLKNPLMTFISVRATISSQFETKDVHQHGVKWDTSEVRILNRQNEAIKHHYTNNFIFQSRYTGTLNQRSEMSNCLLLQNFRVTSEVEPPSIWCPNNTKSMIFRIFTVTQKKKKGSIQWKKRRAKKIRPGSTSNAQVSLQISPCGRF